MTQMIKFEKARKSSIAWLMWWILMQSRKGRGTETRKEEKTSFGVENL